MQGLDHSQLAAMYSRGEVKPSLSIAVSACHGKQRWRLREPTPLWDELPVIQSIKWPCALLVHEIHSSFGSDMITLHPGPWWARKDVQSMDPRRRPTAVMDFASPRP